MGGGGGGAVKTVRSVTVHICFCNFKYHAYETHLFRNEAVVLAGFLIYADLSLIANNWKYIIKQKKQHAICSMYLHNVLRQVRNEQRANGQQKLRNG